MAAAHKNKTLATLMASLLGATGAHRFYLYGRRDLWAWVHLTSLPLSAVGLTIGYRVAPAFAFLFATPLMLAALAGALEALVLGLTPDAKWDATHNPDSGRATDSNWPLALILVLTLATGMGGLIFLISRTFDLMFTGGAYG
jgi:TM2 domain-containing membrane protein YozV